MRPAKNKYHQLLDNIGATLERARENAVEAIHQQLIIANWEIGKYIVEYEQGGKEKAEYGSALLDNLAHDLKIK